MASVKNGTLVLVKDDGTAIASTTDATLNVEMDTPDASTKGSSGWAEHIAGQKSWSIDVEGLATFDYSDGNVQQLVEYIRKRTDITIQFLADEGYQYSGSASCTSVSIGAPNEDVATFSGTFVGNVNLARVQVS